MTYTPEHVKSLPTSKLVTELATSVTVCRCNDCIYYENGEPTHPKDAYWRLCAEELDARLAGLTFHQLEAP